MHEFHGLRLRMMSTTRTIRERIPTTRYSIRCAGTSMLQSAAEDQICVKCIIAPLLFWAAILFLSLRLAWRRFRHSHARNPFVPVIMRLLESLTPSGATQFASLHPQINR